VHSRDTASIAALRGRKVRCDMSNIELQHSVSHGVHTFGTGDVRLVASRLKCDRHGNVRAYMKTFVGDAHAASSNIILAEQESREKFALYAHRQQPDIPWLEYLTQVNDVLLGWLDHAQHGHPGPGVVIEDVEDLLNEHFPDVHPVIEGILMPGTVLFAGKPKVGKSLLALYLGLSVARGGIALGRIRVEPGDVLYLSLEDHKRRLQKRLQEMLSNDSRAPARGAFQFATTWPKLDTGGVEAIEAWLQAHPNAKLVVLDTFVKVRGRPKTRDVYKGDYDAAAPLTALAARYPQVCILIIHHCSKRSDAEDFFDRFQNSTGLTAAVEGGMELCRARGTTDCTLEIAHKDLELDAKHAIRHDPDGGWMLLGDANAVLLSAERQSVIDLLLEAGKPMHYKAMAGELGKKEGTTKKLVWEMARDLQLIPTGAGNYELSPTMVAPMHPHESSVTGNQSNQGNQGHRSNQVTGDDGYPGSQRLLSEGNLVTDDKPKEISPIVSRLPRLPEIDDAGVTEIDQDVADVFAAVSADYVPRRPDAPPKVADVDTPLAETATSARKKAGAHHNNRWLFGNWTATRSPADDAPPPIDEAYADAIGRHRDYAGDLEENTI
jgi:AAA domain